MFRGIFFVGGSAGSGTSVGGGDLGFSVLETVGVRMEVASEEERFVLVARLTGVRGGTISTY